MFETIKQLCESNGTTITALCEKITGSKGNLSTWKKGNIRTDYLIKISEYFNVSTDYLLGTEQINSSLPQLSSKELELLNLFNQLNKEEQDAHIAFLKAKNK